jgi:6-phosphogluconolactonase
VTSFSVAATAEAAAAEVAERLAKAIREARDRRGTAHVALAGGTTPRRAYELWARRVGDWAGIEIWFGDERAVGPDHPDSNYRMVVETLLAEHPEPPPRVNRIEGERRPEEAAAAYEAALKERLPIEAGTPVLDVALQGVGPDGHTASLFPGSPALDAPGLCAAVHDAPKAPPDRITLTLRALRAARSVLFLVTGSDKAAAVARLLGPPDPQVPASLLGGPRAELIADRAAASSAQLPERGSAV